MNHKKKGLEKEFRLEFIESIKKIQEGKFRKVKLLDELLK